MPNLITAKISAQTPVISQNMTYNQKPVQINETQNNKPKKDKFAFLPLGMLAGGTLLIYYGVHKPSIKSVFKQITKEHSLNMEKEVQNFFKAAKSFVNESFDKTVQNIYKYKQKRTDFISQKLDINITKSQTPEDIMKKQNSAFKVIDMELNMQLRFQSSEFDRFSVKLDEDIRELRGKIGHEKWQTELRLKDLVNVDSTPNYIQSVGKERYNSALEKAQNKLNEHLNDYCAQMASYTERKVQKSVNLQSKLMANIIVELRDLITENKQNIIKSSFEKMSELLKLKDFSPKFGNVITGENFTHLDKEALKPPSKIPETLTKMFEGNGYFNAVKLLDFNKLNEEQIKKIFYQTSAHYNLNDIGIMIDRIRLLNVFEKSININNERIYKNIIAKLEGLYLKLNDYGQEQFLKSANQDFSNLAPEAFKAKLIHINNISRRLGYHSVTQANRHFLRDCPQYSKLPLRKYSEIIRDNPEKYFM